MSPSETEVGAQCILPSSSKSASGSLCQKVGVKLSFDPVCCAKTIVFGAGIVKTRTGSKRAESMADRRSLRFINGTPWYLETETTRVLYTFRICFSTDVNGAVIFNTTRRDKEVGSHPYARRRFGRRSAACFSPCI